MSTATASSELNTFLMECNSVCAGNLKEITGLRARARRTGLPLSSMRIAAEAASVQIVRDGKELKVIPLQYERRDEPVPSAAARYPDVQFLPRLANASQEHVTPSHGTATDGTASPDKTSRPAGVHVPPVMTEGEAYAGLIVGKDGEPGYHLILLPEEASEVNWLRARDWASEIGGELPTLREMALLFANLREHFRRFWYWSGVQHETRAQLVWGQNFASGIQTVYGRPFRGHARAVRRVYIG